MVSLVTLMPLPLELGHGKLPVQRKPAENHSVTNCTRNWPGAPVSACCVRRRPVPPVLVFASFTSSSRSAHSAASSASSPSPSAATAPSAPSAAGAAVGAAGAAGAAGVGAAGVCASPPPPKVTDPPAEPPAACATCCGRCAPDAIAVAGTARAANKGSAKATRLVGRQVRMGGRSPGDSGASSSAF